MSNRSVIRHRKRGTKGTHPLLITFKGRGRSGIINICSRIDSASWAAASAADRREYQLERLASRRRRQRERVPNRVRRRRSNSIADHSHQHLREIERRRRQAERKAHKAGGG
jgi:hypothetical protein